MICDSAAKDAKKPSSMQEDHEDDPAKTKAYTLLLLYLLPRYHFACRQYAADLSLPPGTAFFRRAFLLTVDIRPRLLGIAFDRSCSQGIANPCLAAVLHDRRLSVSGDTDTSCPVQSIWLLNDSYDRPLFAVCQPDRRRKMQFWQHLQIRQY